MDIQYSIKVYKQYFNFACAHFLIFEDGSREPLHGHNYRVAIKGDHPVLKADLVFDFLDIKPIVRQVCDQLDHKLILPLENPHLSTQVIEKQTQIMLSSGDHFSFPTADLLWLPMPNTSAERLAIYLAHQITERTWDTYHFKFASLEVEVEETPGQSALYKLLS